MVGRAAEARVAEARAATARGAASKMGASACSSRSPAAAAMSDVTCSTLSRLPIREWWRSEVHRGKASHRSDTALAAH